MSDQSHYPVYRRRQDASKYLRERFGLNYGPSTLAKFATVGGGPRFVHAGRFPLYPEAELDAWALSRISPLKASTSDSGSVGPATVHEKLSTQDGDDQNRPPPCGLALTEDRCSAFHASPSTSMVTPQPVSPCTDNKRVQVRRCDRIRQTHPGPAATMDGETQFPAVENAQHFSENFAPGTSQDARRDQPGTGGARGPAPTGRGYEVQ